MDATSEFGKIFIPFRCQDQVTGGDRWEITDQCCKVVFFSGSGEGVAEYPVGSFIAWIPNSIP